MVWRERQNIRRYFIRNRAELVGLTLANPISYILILSVMVVAPVSQIAPMREISTLIGAFIGGRLFAEEQLRRRLGGCIDYRHRCVGSGAWMILRRTFHDSF